MYRKLTEVEVRALPRKFNMTGRDVVISHVGDGEYVCNIFGNVFSSHWMALKSARKVLGESINAYMQEYMEGRDGEILLVRSDAESFPNYRTINPKIAHLTVETINTTFYPGS
jgi:hypothetical protein